MTPKQAAFVREYLIDLNATQAAIRAGYSARTANEKGSQLLAQVSIHSAIAEAKAARAEKLGIDAEWVLKRLHRDATADLSDLYDDSGNLRPIHQWPAVWRTGLVVGIETVQERDGEDADGKPQYATVRKVKLSERVKIVELIGRHVGVGAFKENLNLTGNIVVNVLTVTGEQERAKVWQKP